MTEHAVFPDRFFALDVSTRAALVFRYREDLPVGHVAQLVGRKPEQVARDMERALAELSESGALPRTAESAEPGRSAAEGELRVWLEKLSAEPELSSFSLVLAVRGGRGSRRFWRRRG